MLFTPLTLRCGLVLKNRVALAPLTNRQSHEDGLLGEDELNFLARRADGDFGTVATCAAYVAQDGKAWGGELGVDRDECLPGLTRLAARIHQGGAAAMVQLFHGGVRADVAVSGLPTWSASTWHEDAPGFVDPRAATLEDVQRVITQFVAAAVRCEKAGFDGVELHGAHGYLICQFLSRTMNPAGGVPGYSGDLAGRARLAREITHAVRAAVSPRFAVGIRLSFEDFGNAKGMDLDDNLQVASWLAEDGVDFIHASLWDVSRNSAKYPDKHVLPLVRAELPKDVALFAAGKIWTRADAEGALAKGADVLSLGRSGIVNPEWPKQIAAGEPVQQTPVTEQWLLDRAVSPQFVKYLHAFRNMISTALVLAVFFLAGCGGSKKPECYDCGGPMVDPHTQEMAAMRKTMCTNAKTLQSSPCSPFGANADKIADCSIVDLAYFLGTESCLAQNTCDPYVACLNEKVASGSPFQGQTTTCEDISRPQVPAGVDGEDLSRSTGSHDVTFADYESSYDAPIETCGMQGELDYLLRVTCADGSHPFKNRVDALQSRTHEAPRQAGRCKRNVVEYAVKCPEKLYSVKIDGYRCPTSNE
ncbi:MAG TPA: NADH:flavin oxidoreductase [Kofleriaceae bacterium]|jgi:2,4-dienoyl-CoA reductase-like NADH-dependent reductase (Old Yellow Enzyme family)